MTNATPDAVTPIEAADRRGALAGLVRGYQRDVDSFDQAVADLLGVHRVDLRCLDIMLANAVPGDQQQPMTPKQLAVDSGLSPSSITTVLDRLERNGYVRRVRDEANRRQVQLVLTQRFGQLVEEIFAPVAAAGQAHLADYSDAEVEVLIRFFTRAHLQQLEQIGRLQCQDTP